MPITILGTKESDSVLSKLSVGNSTGPVIPFSITVARLSIQSVLHSIAVPTKLFFSDFDDDPDFSPVFK